jgi:aspartate aminotransferase-like enzyme
MGPFVDSAFRIGHMGDIRMADVERTLTALGEVLGEMRQRKSA